MSSLMLGQSMPSASFLAMQNRGVADTPDGYAGSSKRNIGYFTFTFKIHGNPSRNIMKQYEILSNVEEVFYLQQQRWRLADCRRIQDIPGGFCRKEE